MENENRANLSYEPRGSNRQWVLTQDYIYETKSRELILVNNYQRQLFHPIENYIMIIEKTLHQIRESLSGFADKFRIPVEDVSFRITEMLPKGPSKVGGVMCGLEEFIFNLTHKYGKHSETPPNVVSALDLFITLTHIEWALDEAESTINNA